MNDTNWTIETIAARLATGDGLVTAGTWCVSFDSGCSFTGSRLSVIKPGRWGYDVCQRGERDGETFESTDAAECHALNCGYLQWYHDTDVYLASCKAKAV